jgi:hypothetical protein
MGVKRPKLFTDEEIAAMLEPEEVTRRRFEEAARNSCVLKKLEASGEVGPGWAAVCEGRLVGWAPTWDELEAILVRDGWYWSERYPIGLVCRRVQPANTADPAAHR